MYHNNDNRGELLQVYDSVKKNKTALSFSRGWAAYRKNVLQILFSFTVLLIHFSIGLDVDVNQSNY